LKIVFQLKLLLDASDERFRKAFRGFAVKPYCVEVFFAWLLCRIRRSLLSELLSQAPAFSNHLINGDSFAFSGFDAPDLFRR